MAMSSGGGSSVSGVNSDINVTPMADIMLVLLIIFMITTPLLEEGVPITKPKAVNAAEEPDLDAEGATTVSITPNQDVYLNKTLLPMDQLVDQLIDRRNVAPDLPLFVRGDVSAPYGTVVEVINRARDAGYERIGLVVDREKGRGGGN